MNKQKNDRFTFHQNGMIQKIETVPVRRDRRNPLPIVVQITDAAIVALFFIAVAWLVNLIATGGGDMFAGLMMVVMTKSALIKQLESLNDDAEIVILLHDWGIDDNGNLVGHKGDYVQFSVVEVIDCGEHCHAELLAGEIIGW